MSTFTEVDRHDDPKHWIWDRNPYNDGPPYEEGTCTCDRCGATIGWALDTREDSYGRERECWAWTVCFTDGTEQICEDCEDAIRHPDPSASGAQR